MKNHFPNIEIDSPLDKGIMTTVLNLHHIYHEYWKIIYFDRHLLINFLFEFLPSTLKKAKNLWEING
jgi:hypothetical protein